MARKSRKIEYFTMHAHIEGGNPNYRTLFTAIAGLRGDRRVLKDSSRTFAIPVMRVDDESAFFVIYEGDDNMTPIIFNAEDGTERHEELEIGEFIVEKTHVVVNFARRVVLVEYVQKGAKAFHVEKIVESLGRRFQDFPRLQFGLTPVIADDFVGEIAKFERIREVHARLEKPNADWNDWYTSLTGVADESAAKDFEITMRAARDQSLSVLKGIVKVVKDFIGSPKSPLKSARITGRRTGEESETTINTKKHVSHRRMQVRVDDDGYVNADDIEKKMKQAVGE